MTKANNAPCPICKGKGEVWKRAYAEGAWLEPCAECNGTGSADIPPLPAAPKPRRPTLHVPNKKRHPK